MKQKGIHHNSIQRHHTALEKHQFFLGQKPNSSIIQMKYM